MFKHNTPASASRVQRHRGMRRERRTQKLHNIGFTRLPAALLLSRKHQPLPAGIMAAISYSRTSSRKGRTGSFRGHRITRSPPDVDRNHRRRTLKFYFCEFSEENFPWEILSLQYCIITRGEQPRFYCSEINVRYKLVIKTKTAQNKI